MNLSKPTSNDRIVRELRAAGCVFAEEEAALLVARATDEEDLARLVTRRTTGEPLEHLLGSVRFGGLDLEVGPGVFVPRQRTAHLAALAAALLSPGDLLVDLCCGCGAVAAVAADRVPGLRVVAADVEPAAVALARRNLAAYDAQVLLGDLDAPLPRSLRGAVDVLTANVPYVPTAAIAGMPPEARDHEPRAALDGGTDGLDLVRRVAQAAPGWLRTGGTLLVEVGEDQAPAAAAAFAAEGLEPAVHTDDELAATTLTGTRR